MSAKRLNWLLLSGPKPIVSASAQMKASDFLDLVVLICQTLTVLSSEAVTKTGSVRSNATERTESKWLGTG